MSTVDVSVVLNMHREAPYLRATLASLDTCAVAARETGLCCELVAVFDRADDATRRVFDATRLEGFASTVVIEVDFGSLGLARNAGVDAASGEYIWTADGDDLVSRNAIIELHRTAQSHPDTDCAVFINYLVAFGESFHVSKYFDDTYLTVADFAYQHPYVSRIFFKRSVFSRLRYSDLRVSSGFAYEDWEFNVQLRYLGFKFLIADNTIFFYRQRPGSLLRQANSTSACIIPQGKFFDPAWFSNEFEFEKNRINDWSEFFDTRRKVYTKNYSSEIFNSPELLSYLLEACLMDPEVDPFGIERASSYPSVLWHQDHWGFRLAEAYRLAGPDPFTDVVLLPWLNAGGAEKYILQVLQELAASDPSTNFLVLCGEPSNTHLWADKLPRRSTLLDIYNAFPTLGDEDRDRLTVRLLLGTTCPKARLHIKTSIFSHRLINCFGSVLLDHFSGIYYRFSDQRFTWRGFRIDAFHTIRFLRSHLAMLDAVICDCQKIADQDLQRIGLAKNKYHVLYGYMEVRTSPAKIAAPKNRILWASRVSSEKRPELLVLIAQQLQRVIPELIIDVFGSANEDKNALFLFDSPGLRYAGPFDGFESIPTEEYDAFVYTSAFDGLPNVILEALGAGLPVVAADVGGISEAVITGETGVLVPDESDDQRLIRHYVGAVLSLYEDWNTTCSMALSARNRVATQHGKSLFVQRISEVFDLKTQLYAAVE